MTDYILMCFAMVASILMFAFMCFGNIEKKYKAFAFWLVLSLLSIFLFALIAYCKLHPFCNLNSFFNLNWLL